MEIMYVFGRVWHTQLLEQQRGHQSIGEKSCHDEISNWCLKCEI